MLHDCNRIKPISILSYSTHSSESSFRLQKSRDQADVMAALLVPVSPPKDAKQEVEIAFKHTESAPISSPAASAGCGNHKSMCIYKIGIATLTS